MFDFNDFFDKNMDMTKNMVCYNYQLDKYTFFAENMCIKESIEFWFAEMIMANSAIYKLSFNRFLKSKRYVNRVRDTNKNLIFSI